jgi:heat shock protein HslJ
MLRPTAAALAVGLIVQACSELGLPSEMLGLGWQLDSIVTASGVVDASVLGAEPATARFGADPERTDYGRVTGFSGCNTYVADFRVPRGTQLTITNLTSTAKACLPPAPGMDAIGPIESAFQSALDETRSFTLTATGLILHTSAGDALWLHRPVGTE